MWNAIEPIPTTRYLASSPSSIYMLEPCSSNLENADLVAVMCLEAPLSTFHPTFETMLVERHKTMEKAVSTLNYGCKLINSCRSVCTLYKLLLLLLLSLPLLLKTLRSIILALVALEALDVTQVLLLLVQRSRIFLLLLTLPRSSFPYSLDD
jgi:hypothetical protein